MYAQRRLGRTQVLALYFWRLPLRGENRLTLGNSTSPREQICPDWNGFSLFKIWCLRVKISSVQSSGQWDRKNCDCDLRARHLTCLSYRFLICKMQRFINSALLFVEALLCSKHYAWCMVNRIIPLFALTEIENWRPDKWVIIAHSWTQRSLNFLPTLRSVWDILEGTALLYMVPFISHSLVLWMSIED